MDPLTMDWRHRRQPDDLPLFAAPSVPVDTSEDAAEAIRPHVHRLHRVVLAALAASPNGLTRQELEAQTGLDGNTVRPRVLELRVMRCVVEQDTTRPTTSGRASRVLAITDVGHRTLRRAG